ncbi:hypothetical protein [Clostridium akagii]|uniref:hypothetical protein n=1 Tax=Clostridium akagii TaxID=91623 RepID=UPI00047A1CAA|nr:hypothetical protein [Clostridium akagii]
MKKIGRIILILLMAITLSFSNLVAVAKADTKGNCLVRIEGLSGTIVKGYGTGNTAEEVAIDVLKQNKIQYSGDKSYLSEIDNIKSGSIQHGYDGWMNYVKHADGKTVDAPYPYTPVSGDEIVFYYGNKDMNTAFLNSLKFSPEVVQPGTSFTMTFSWKHDSYDDNWNPIPTNSPIVGAQVTIDNENYVTNSNGGIQVKGLKYGSHTYKISGYNKDQPPTVVMDEGTFNIDGKNAPGFSYKDSSYSNTIDNNGILADVDKEISSTANALSQISDPWIAVDMKKLGLNSNKQFALDFANTINDSGVKNISNTELEKEIISLTSIGYTPYDFMGQDLVQELYNRDINDFQINDLIFALSAYNYGNISSSKYKITKDDLKNTIINKKIPTGGWTFTGNLADPDITGMALYALAPYYNSDNKVKASIDSAVNYLTNAEDISGYISSNNGKTSETLSMVILGLTSIGIDPGQGDFLKTNGNLVKALLSFKGVNGNYKHTLDDPLGTDLSTEEALRALIALKSFNDIGSYNFYSSNIDASKLSVYDYAKQDTSGNHEEPAKQGGQPSLVAVVPGKEVASIDRSTTQTGKTTMQPVQTALLQNSQIQDKKTTLSGEAVSLSNPSKSSSTKESSPQKNEEKLVKNSSKTLATKGGFIDSEIVICLLLIVIALVSVGVVVLRGKRKAVVK